MDFEKRVKNSIEFIKDFGLTLDLGRPHILKVRLSRPIGNSKYWNKLDLYGNETKYYNVADTILLLKGSTAHPYDLIVENSETNMLLDTYESMWNLIGIHPDYSIGCTYGMWDDKRMTVDMILRKKYRKAVDLKLFKGGYELGKNIRKYTDDLYNNT